jgi:phospholipid transport system substrate-binding protein
MAASMVNANADQAEKTAQAVVESTTQQMMDIIVEAQGYFDEDPDRFYSTITPVLNNFMDFKSFARGVMGDYASKKTYQSLPNKAEKDKLKQQVARFTKVFQDSLVQTYAKGLLAFNGNKVEILPPEDKNPSDSETSKKSSSVTVTQHVYGDAEKPYVIHYKMRKNRAGEWKVRNVTIEAINLGKVYKSQFYSAVKQYNGNVDQAVDNWTVDPSDDSGS